MTVPKAAPWFYQVLLTLLVPFAMVRLWWRGRSQPGYRAHISERFGFIDIPAGDPIIWLHAVSVGETRAAEPLVHALLKQYPAHRVLLTHMTPTGRATSTLLFQDPRVLIAYLPYDLTSAVDRFLTRVQPRFGLLMETEIWPNLILRGHHRQIPILLINARLSARSEKRYARFDHLIRPVLSALTAVGAQTPEDADRLRALGAQNIIVTGNLKFDVCIDPTLQALGKTWRQGLSAQRPVWLAASTREGEEAIILDALRLLCSKFKDQKETPLLVLVPRHPQRFNAIAEQVQRAGFRVGRRSLEPAFDQLDVWLGDSMGEMVAYYSMTDVAVIGGSLLPFGGQNLIEAAACGIPTVIGPHTYNFASAANTAVAMGAAHRLTQVNATTLADSIHQLVSRPERLTSAANATIRFVKAATGATHRTLQLITQQEHITH